MIRDGFLLGIGIALSFLAIRGIGVFGVLLALGGAYVFGNYGIEISALMLIAIIEIWQFFHSEWALIAVLAIAGFLWPAWKNRGSIPRDSPLAACRRERARRDVR